MPRHGTSRTGCSRCTARCATTTPSTGTRLVGTRSPGSTTCSGPCRDNTTFSSDCEEARMVGSLINFLDPPRHGQLRALVSRAFTPRRVAEREARVREIAVELLDDLDRDHCDLLEEYAAVLPVPGDRRDDRAPRRRCSSRSGCAPRRSSPVPTQGELAASLFTMIGMYQELLADRRPSPDDDLMSGAARCPDRRRAPAPRTRCSRSASCSCSAATTPPAR